MVVLYDTLAAPFRGDEPKSSRSNLVTGLVVLGLSAAAAVMLFFHNRERF